MFFGATLGQQFCYTTSDCYVNFAFPAHEGVPALNPLGKAYHDGRTGLMEEYNEGLTKIYNRFHDREETSPDIERLRELHAAMDRAVLESYGWHDLAAAAEPRFIEQEADEGKKTKTRLDWPPEFKDEVLARLLALNAERAAEERAAGLVAAPEDEEEVDEDEAA